MKDNNIIDKWIKFYKSIFSWMKNLPVLQTAFLGILLAMLILVSIVAVVQENDKLAQGNAIDSETEDGVQVETENTSELLGDGGVSNDSELSQNTESTETTDSTENSEITEQPTESEEEEKIIEVSMTTTSIEKDLKIKFVDEKNKLVKGHTFVITITKVGEKNGVVHKDENQNGTIYISDLAAGTYQVEVQELEGVSMKKKTLKANVKDKIVYEKVEIENEIKDESEIDASKEDTANKNVVVENEVKDTLPLLESTIITTEVLKELVELTDFPVAAQSVKKNRLTVYKVIHHKNASMGDSLGMESLTESTETNDRIEKDGSAEIENSTELDVFIKSSASNENTESGEILTEILATALVYLPEEVRLYPCGKVESTQCDLLLEIEDSSAIIQEIEWLIAEDAVVEVTVSEDKRSLHLTAKTMGETTLTAKITYQSEEGVSSSQEISCKIVVGEYEEETTQLKDLEGNLLYADAEAKVIATQKNYTTAERFYTNPQYTGWQTFDGKLYYYTEEHIPAIGMHFIGGAKYEFNEDGSMIEKEESLGIDVSKWQGEIDWKAVADAGIKFAIIRCGYRGSASGELIEDPMFKKNIEGAVSNGIKVGVYVFSQAITNAEAIEEASMAITLVQGYDLQLPIFIDTEQAGGRADRLSKDVRTEIMKSFCETVKNAGYKAGIYASKFWFYDNLHADQLSFYHIWVAQYNTECTYEGRYDMWQYTEKGKVNGIPEKVDMNICYTKY